MTIKTFKGGIHPPERKVATEGKAIERITLPKQVVIPINQHFGPPNRPLVKVGDTVKRGQKIADADAPLCVPVHASVAGVVKKLEPRLQSNNLDGLCVIIESTEVQEDAFLPPLDAFTCSKEEALARIREAGLVGMGGAAFPVHIKLNPPPNKKIDLVIANGAECEPYLTIDEATMIEDAEKIVEGLGIAMRIVGVSKGVIAMEDNKKRALDSLEAAVRAKSQGADIRIQLLKTKYPQGGEKMLIAALTGREVPSGGLPMDVGCIVQNVGTLRAISEAFTLGQPLIERGLTVSGGACDKARDIMAPIGSLMSELDDELFGADPEKIRKIVFGGPMMGVAVPHTNIPIQKNSSGVLLLNEKEAKAYQEGPCIRCGRCLRACACRLPPVLMNAALDARDFEGAAALGLMDCIECGACTFVCPARIQLVQRFRVGKQLLRAKQAAKPKAAAKA